MQSERLFKIIYILLDKKKVTAASLANELEVSVRTIYRDIEKLSASQIPVFTDNGRNGGISLLDNFVLDKSLLTEKDQSEILIGLQSLAATQYPDSNDILKKVTAIFHKGDYNWIEVDFSRWGFDINKQKDLFNNLKTSILNKQIVSFDYFNGYGELSSRNVEPAKLLYKDKHWYLYGFCSTKNNYRLFKITRIKNLFLTNNFFDKTHDKAAIEQNFEMPDPLINLELLFSKKAVHRVYDVFDDSVIKKAKDGQLQVNVSMPENDWLLEFLMSFGENVHILYPEHIKDELKERHKKASKSLET